MNGPETLLAQRPALTVTKDEFAMADRPFKTCPLCKQSLPASAYNLARNNPDGLYSYCRECDKEFVRERKLGKRPELAAKEAEREREFAELIPGELWKDIPGWEGFYQASSHGRIRSLPRTVNAPNRWGHCMRTYPGRIMKQRPTPHFGHMTVGLVREGRGGPKLVHRLVCEAFYGPCPPDKQHCAHRDGNPANNRPENLRWATVKENSEDTRRHGTMRVGEKSNLAKLTEDDVLEIRRRSANGETGYRIAKDTGLTGTAIYKIINRENWKHI